MFIQFVKFAGVGAIGTMAHYTALMLLVQLFDANAVLASSIGAIIGAIVNYILNYHYTFNSSKAHTETAWKFFTIASVGFVLNALMMALLTEILTLFYLFAQVISTGVVLIWNFLGNRLWTFQENVEKKVGNTIH